VCVGGGAHVRESFPLQGCSYAQLWGFAVEASGTESCCMNPGCSTLCCVFEVGRWVCPCQCRDMGGCLNLDSGALEPKFRCTVAERVCAGAAVLLRVVVCTAASNVMPVSTTMFANGMRPGVCLRWWCPRHGGSRLALHDRLHCFARAPALQSQPLQLQPPSR
jgi:hypothetical protein